MDTLDIQKQVKETVAAYFNARADKADGFELKPEHVYVVWQCKTLQNWKVMASTTVPDGMYYEVTHNGDARETYIDAYRKWESVCIPDVA